MSDETLSAGFGNILVRPASGPVMTGGVAFHADERMLIASGREIRLEPKTAELLTFLADQKNMPVTREALLDEVWGESGSDEALTQAISRLRRAFKELGGQPAAIETVPRVGYRLIDPTSVPSLTPARSEPRQVSEADHAPGSHRFRTRFTHAAAFGAGVVAGAAAVMLAVLIWLTPTTENIEIRIGPDGQIITDQP